MDDGRAGAVAQAGAAGDAGAAGGARGAAEEPAEASSPELSESPTVEVKRPAARKKAKKTKKAAKKRVEKKEPARVEASPRGMPGGRVRGARSTRWRRWSCGSRTSAGASRSTRRRCSGGSASCGSGAWPSRCRRASFPTATLSSTTDAGRGAAACRSPVVDCFVFAVCVRFGPGLLGNRQRLDAGRRFGSGAAGTREGTCRARVRVVESERSQGVGVMRGRRKTERGQWQCGSVCCAVKSWTPRVVVSGNHRRQIALRGHHRDACA